MKKICFALMMVLALAATWSFAQSPFVEGQPMVNIKLRGPDSAKLAEYLGVAKAPANFGVADIQKPVVLLEIFNMYCTVCQGEARGVNELYRLINTHPQLKGQMAVIGIGVGNSDFEVDVFRKKYNIAFPLFPDSNYLLHKQFKEPRTPTFVLIRTKGKSGSMVLYHHAGPIGDPKAFLQTLRAKARLE